MARSNPREWSDAAVVALLATKGWSGADLIKAFPGIPLPTIREARRRFAATHAHLAPAVPDASVEPVAVERDPDTVPRATHEATLRQLYEVKHKRADYLAAVEQAATDAVALIRVPAIPRPQKDGRRKGEEVAVALLSDLQTGKITPDYSSDVARERVMRYARKVVSLANVQRKDHPVRKCVVAMLGDMLEGVDIFPGQQWLIDDTLYRQVFETTPSILVDFLTYLLANFEEVEVWAVQGNHGRLGRKGQYGPEDNADRMVYRLVKMLMREEKRLHFVMADPKGERAWYLVGHVGEWSALLLHGDQIKPVLGLPFYGIGKKLGGWASGGISEPFGDILMGHWHQNACIPYNKRKVWINGSTESTNTYAQEYLAAAGDPSQRLLFIDPEKGRVTANFEVYLLEEN